MLPLRPFPNPLPILCLLVGILALAGAASAEAEPIAETCEAPISTCRQLPVPLESSADALRPDVFPPPMSDDCPKGFACTCVPSCPDCDDCAAQVCVPDPTRECRTACDCPTGLGCFDGECIAGFAPVYCCDEGFCPVGEACQASDGSAGSCAEPDPSCRERAALAGAIVAKHVERYAGCREDADCVLVDTDTGCGGTCGAYVNHRRVKAFNKKLDRIDRKLCSDYQELGCPFATPGCLATEGRCVNRRCEAAPILPGPVPRPLEPEARLGAHALRELEPAR